jgi:hypothetical protein
MNCSEQTPRPLFTDGFNSLAHVVLGFAFGRNLLAPFLTYQYVLKPDHNSTIDSLEFAAGWMLREKLDKRRLR